MSKQGPDGEDGRKRCGRREKTRGRKGKEGKQGTGGEILQFRKLTKAELEIIVPILDSANQTVTYYDPYKKANYTMTTYTGDYEITNKNIVGESNHKNEGFQVSFIAVSKRS